MRMSPEMLGAVSAAAATLLAGLAICMQLAQARTRRKGVDAAISVEAFAARSAIRSWLNGDYHLMALGGASPRFEPKEEWRDIQARLEQAVAQSPHASRGVAKAVKDAYGLFVRATGQGRTLTAADLVAKSPEAAASAGRECVRQFEECVERLTRAVGPGLRDW